MSELACGYCHQTFADLAQLKVHVADEHSEAFPAQILTLSRANVSPNVVDSQGGVSQNSLEP